MLTRETDTFARKTDMLTADAYIERASIWSKALVKATGVPVKADPYSAASRLVKRATGAQVPASIIRSLARRAGSLKEVGGHVHDALALAYAKECQRQKRLLEHEIAIATAAGAVSSVVDEAQALVRDMEGST